MNFFSNEYTTNQVIQGDQQHYKIMNNYYFQPAPPAQAAPELRLVQKLRGHKYQQYRLSDRQQEFNTNILSRVKSSVGRFKSDVLSIKMACLAEKGVLFENEHVKVVSKIQESSSQVLATLNLMTKRPVAVSLKHNHQDKVHLTQLTSSRYSVSIDRKTPLTDCVFLQLEWQPE